MSEYALNDLGLKLEDIRKGNLPKDEYQIDTSSVFPSCDEVETQNPYLLSLASLLFGNEEEKPKNPYEMELSNVLNGDLKVKVPNPYIIDLNELFKEKIQVKKQINPYVLDLTDVFKKDMIVKKQKNPYELDLSNLFPDSSNVKYNPYTMDIKKLSKKDEIHIKKELSNLLNNYIECKVNDTEQEQEAVSVLLDKYGVSIDKVKSGRPSIIKLGNTLYIPNDYMEEIEKVLKEQNILVD